MTYEFPPGRPFFVRQGRRQPRHNSPEWRLQTRFNHHLLQLRRSGMSCQSIAGRYQVSEHVVWSRSTKAARQLRDSDFWLPPPVEEHKASLEQENTELRAEIERLKGIIRNAFREAA